MTELSFVITFHSPVMAATGAAADGYDATADLANTVTAPALKGLMRAAAAHTLQLRPEFVERVFGTPGTPSPWQWIVEQHAEARAVTRHRVAIDPSTSTAVDGQIQMARAAMSDPISFSVEHTGDANADDVIVICGAARAVHAMGAQRRRGLGWVGVAGGPGLTDNDLERLTGEMRR